MNIIKEIPLANLDADQRQKLDNSLNLFHESLLKETKVDPSAILVFDGEYQFLEANEGSLFLLMPTKVILERREKQA